MWYELSLKVGKTDEKGNEKEVTEKYVTDQDLFAQCELKGLELYNNGCDVCAIKRSNIREFINQRTDDTQRIFKTCIVDIFVNDDGSEKEQKYYVALFAKDAKEATNKTLEYMRQGMTDMELVSVNRTTILDII
jgi:hypothetical protein